MAMMAALLGWRLIGQRNEVGSGEEFGFAELCLLLTEKVGHELRFAGALGWKPEDTTQSPIAWQIWRGILLAGYPTLDVGLLINV